MDRLTYEEMTRRGKDSYRMVEELRELYKREGLIYEPSILARRPTLPGRKGKGLRASVSYYFALGIYYLWSGVHEVIVEPIRQRL